MEYGKNLWIKNKKDAVLVLDKDGRILHASSPVEALSGYKPEELIGRSLADFSPAVDERKKVLAAIKESTAQEAVAVEEFRFRHKGQKDFWAEMIIVPFRATAEYGVGSQCLLRSVTRQREADRRLEEAHAMRSQFTATVSHELRTPLLVIRETLAMLLAGEAGSLGDGQRHFLNMAQSNVERLEKLIAETLDLKALEEGRLTLHFRENSMGEIFGEIEKMKRHGVEKKGLGLIVLPDPQLPRINFDREQILECFGILVDFSLRGSGKGDIVVRAFREDNALHMSVRSPSLEKPCDDLSRLFLRFEPLNEAEKVKLGRTGVEFARAKEIIKKHSGKIWAEFLPEEGTFFHILLPIWERRARPE